MLDGPELEPADCAADSLVILLHGYGADGNDLIQLAHHLRDSFPATAFLAPNAPERLPDPGFGGRQWFPLTLRDPTEYWRGVTGAAPSLNAYIDAQLDRYALHASRLALVGFSQGTMMALHVALRRQPAIAALIGFSGIIAGPENLANDIATRPPVLLIHGEADPVIPIEALDITTRALQSAAVPVEAHRRPGLGHGIDPEGLAQAASFLERHLSPANR